MGIAPCAVLIPTLGRPRRVAEIARNLRSASPAARPVFIIESSDEETVQAAAGHDALIGDFGNYSVAINHAIRRTAEPFVFTGADDLMFHPGWLEHALGAAAAHPEAGVIGTDDLGNPYVALGLHSTHSLIRRSYAERGGMTAGVLMHEGYTHNFTDVELVEVARARRAFRACLDARAEHLHPDFQTREPDATHERTRRAIDADRALFLERRESWRQQIDPVLTY